MAKQLHRLSARAVATLTKPGRHADGGGLYLTIGKTGAKRWTFMFERRGRQREAGFGSIAAVSLAEARAKAAECRSLLAKGVDPLDAKKAARHADASRQTFEQCADALIASKRSEWRSAKHALQWETTLKVHCKPIREFPIDAVDTSAVLSLLQPLWAAIPETASRVRGRIEAVLDYGKAHGLRSGENPAAWRGHLALILPKQQKLARGHHAAMPYSDVPAFLACLRERPTIVALALEFLILTAARSGEVLGATWNEFDFAPKVWMIPSERMKAGRPHRVPLSGRAMAILENFAEFRTGDFVFPGQRPGKPLSGTAFSTMMRRMNVDGATIHGFRSSFRDWAGNETPFARELAETALAHVAGDATEQAYRRADALEKRRGLMEAWAAFCEPESGSKNVISIARNG
jgi:integrase